jgi:AcrR family transcriptional regulator
MSEKYNIKQQQILDKGKELFWKFGFRRVSIEEICREARVSKMTFYKYFPNKQELAITILDIIFDESLEKIRTIGRKGEAPEETLETILQLKFESSTGISEEFIRDLYVDQDSPIKAYVEQKSATVFQEVIQLYERGKKDGWVRKDLNVPFMIYFTRKSIDWITSEEAPPYFRNSQEMIMELTRLFIYGIAPHNK